MPDDALELKQLAKDLKKSGSPWEMDESTSMARMTETERRQRLGFTPPANEMQIAEAEAADASKRWVTLEMAATETIGAPSAYDLRNVGGKNFTTSVKDQGGCGSCVAFGSIAVLETTMRRQRNNGNMNVDLSEAQMFYCHAAEEGRNCGNGWWPDNAFKKAKDHGITFEEHFGYTPGDQACNLSSSWQDDVATPTGHTKLTSRNAIKQWISTKGSVTGCFIVYQDFFAYRTGVYRHVSGESAGGHCVEIIGYNNSQGCWICKNSWGPGWGENGYFRIAFGEANIDSWAGPYGVEGVTLRSWNRNVTINGLWTNRSERNAYAHLAGIGWRKISSDNATVQHSMLSQLITAKAATRRVDALEDGNQIKEIYVV